MGGFPFGSTPDDDAQNWAVGICPELSGFDWGSGVYGFHAGWASGCIGPRAVCVFGLLLSLPSVEATFMGGSPLGSAPADGAPAAFVAHGGGSHKAEL